jgi:hypothetical protein
VSDSTFDALVWLPLIDGVGVGMPMPPFWLTLDVQLQPPLAAGVHVDKPKPADSIATAAPWQLMVVPEISRQPAASSTCALPVVVVLSV